MRLHLYLNTQFKLTYHEESIFLFAFLGVFSLTGAMAQSCGSASAAKTKSCCAAKADKAAMGDATIEKRTNEDGTASYVRKEADAQGNVRFVAVSYDEKANAFVNVAPPATLEKKSCASATGAKSCCSAKEASAKSCCSSKAKASCEKKESKVEN